MTPRPSLLLRLRGLLLVGLALLAAACSTLDRGQPPVLDRQASWTVLPFTNHTETPLAGSRAEAIAESLLGGQGVGRIRHYPGPRRRKRCSTAPASANNARRPSPGRRNRASATRWPAPSRNGATRSASMANLPSA